MIDNANHPSRYTSDKSGVECIEITRHRNFNIGRAIESLWPAGSKDSNVGAEQIKNLHNAIFYITREIENIEDDIADSEEEFSTWTTSDYSKKLYDAILDDSISAEEFDNLAAAKANHPAGKHLVGNQYIENVFNNIIDSGINYDEVLASSIKRYNNSRDDAIAQKDWLAGKKPLSQTWQIKIAESLKAFNDVFDYPDTDPTTNELKRR
jgi:hypothetical protein